MVAVLNLALECRKLDSLLSRARVGAVNDGILGLPSTSGQGGQRYHKAFVRCFPHHSTHPHTHTPPPPTTTHYSLPSLTCTYIRFSWTGSFLSTFWSEKKNLFLSVRMAVSLIPCSLKDLSELSQFTVKIAIAKIPTLLPHHP